MSGYWSLIKVIAVFNDYLVCTIDAGTDVSIIMFFLSKDGESISLQWEMVYWPYSPLMLLQAQCTYDDRFVLKNCTGSLWRCYVFIRTKYISLKLTTLLGLKKMLLKTVQKLSILSRLLC